MPVSENLESQYVYTACRSEASPGALADLRVAGLGIAGLNAGVDSREEIMAQWRLTLSLICRGHNLGHSEVPGL